MKAWAFLDYWGPKAYAYGKRCCARFVVLVSSCLRLLLSGSSAVSLNHLPAMTRKGNPADCGKNGSH